MTQVKPHINQKTLLKEIQNSGQFCSEKNNDQGMDSDITNTIQHNPQRKIKNVAHIFKDCQCFDVFSQKSSNCFRIFLEFRMFLYISNVLVRLSDRQPRHKQWNYFENKRPCSSQALVSNQNKEFEQSLKK